MIKTLTLLCIGVCIVASPAMAGPRTIGTIAVASNPGLYVRVDAARFNAGNACGSAINTGGVSRATAAVTTGGRVFLVGGGGMGVARPPLAMVPAPRIEVQPVRRPPQGLGALLAGLFGVK